MEIIDKILNHEMSTVKASELLALLGVIWSDGGAELEATYLGKSGGDDLEQNVVKLLPLSTLDVPEEAVTVLVERWAKDRQFYELVHSAIKIAFAKNVVTPLTGGIRAQRTVVDALNHNEQIWKVDMELPDVLANNGLPRSQIELVNFFLERQ